VGDIYSKVACPSCGLHIEYPADTEVISFPCPECSKTVSILPHKPTTSDMEKQFLEELRLTNPEKLSVNAVIQAAVNVLSDEANMGVVNQSLKRPLRIGWMQIGVLDSHTTEICEAYAFNQWDENFEPIRDSLPYDGGCPRHPGCRSVIIPVNLEDAVPEKISFGDWLCQFNKQELEQAFGKLDYLRWQKSELSDAQLVQKKQQKLMDLYKQLFI
jgi:hypothetical protein